MGNGLAAGWTLAALVASTASALEFAARNQLVIRGLSGVLGDPELVFQCAHGGHAHAGRQTPRGDGGAIVPNDVRAADPCAMRRTHVDGYERSFGHACALTV